VIFACDIFHRVMVDDFTKVSLKSSIKHEPWLVRFVIRDECAPF